MSQWVVPSRLLRKPLPPPLRPSPRNNVLRPASLGKRVCPPRETGKMARRHANLVEAHAKKGLKVPLQGTISQACRHLHLCLGRCAAACCYIQRYPCAPGTHSFSTVSCESGMAGAGYLPSEQGGRRPRLRPAYTLGQGGAEAVALLVKPFCNRGELVQSGGIFR